MKKTMEEIKDLVDCIPGYTVVYKVDNGLKRIYYSKNLPELTGHTQEEYRKLISDDPMALVIPGDRENITTKIIETLSKHDNFDLAYRLIHKVGKLVWVRAHGNYIGDLDECPVYLTCIYDVTDEWESKNVILDVSDRGVVVFDKDSKEVLYGNSKFFGFAGKTERECLGSACYDVVCGLGKWDKSQCICFKAIESKGPFINYNSKMDKYFSITASETKWGEHNAIIFFMSDITEEKKNNDELRRMQEKEIKLQEDIIGRLMGKTYESISVINLTSGKVDVLQYNYDSFAESKYQYADYDECVNFFVSTYVQEDDRESYRESAQLSIVKEQLEKNETYSVLFHFVDENQNILLKTITYMYQNNSKKTILGLTQDITEITRKQTETMNSMKEALLRADKATEEKMLFFSNISHDMRTPLNGILGFTNLGMEADSLEDMKVYLSKIHLSGQFLLSLINDTLDMSKMESGRMELVPKKESETEILMGIIYAVEESAKEKGVNLVVKLPDNDKNCVWIDKLRVQQIFTNLLGNAIKFTPSGGRVDFIVEILDKPEYGCSHKITVKDNGIGMKEEFISYAFEPFSQQKGVATEKAMGTGLGLSIVKQIVAMMEGHIDLKSEESKGTTFEVYLPIKFVEGENELKSERWRSVDLNGKHVLLCEDHPINRELACKLLENKNMIVTVAKDGKEGVELFKNSKEDFFDIILMDIRMPIMDGLDATREIRNMVRIDATTIPIIAMTANAYASDKTEVIEAGMNGHISKPIEPKTLFETISKMIARDEV